MQVSTVASESAFSAGGRVVDPFHGRLEPETVEALICTKSWIGASKGSDIASVVKDMDMPSLEEHFTTLVHMLEEPQEDDSDDDLEDFMDEEMED
uniref:HAT C-terminal dimerisation domain-containing protein n=1 Tax=Triticum urartu TaxID=4572 RepID=A0A8R7U1K8_TRIUA